MAYRYGERKQRCLFPQSIDEYILQDSPVRAYDVIIDSLDFKQLGIELDTNKVGCPQYDPRAMLKLLVYGYSYGIRSSRKLERETHYNLSFIWISGGLRPDHKTIAEFRRNNKSAIANVLRQCARICIDLDLIEGNTLFVDGSKIRGNASLKNTWSKERCEQSLKAIDKRIEQILQECENADIRESEQGSLVKLRDELMDSEELKSKVKGVYMVLRPDNKIVEFVEKGTGGFFKGEDPNVAIMELKNSWIEEAQIIYIGKAGGFNSDATLNSRLKQYLSFGQGKKVGHKGGRYIWQIKNINDYIICWKELSFDEPRNIEIELLRIFKERFHNLPFANIVN